MQHRDDGRTTQQRSMKQNNDGDDEAELQIKSDNKSNHKSQITNYELQIITANNKSTITSNTIMMIDHKQRYSDTARTKHSQPQPHHNFKYNTRLRRLSALRGGRPAEVSRGQQMLTQPSLLLLSVHRDDRCSRRWPHGRSRGRTIGWIQPRTIITPSQEQVGLNRDLRSAFHCALRSSGDELGEGWLLVLRELRVLHRSHVGFFQHLPTCYDLRCWRRGAARPTVWRNSKTTLQFPV